MGDDKKQDQTAGPDRRKADSTGARRSIAVSGDHIDSRDLFIGTRELIIDHGGEHYRLRLTAQNKLILTK
jgi:hemin uptake protein HemP